MNLRNKILDKTQIPIGRQLIKFNLDNLETCLEHAVNQAPDDIVLANLHNGCKALLKSCGIAGSSVKQNLLDDITNFYEAIDANQFSNIQFDLVHKNKNKQTNNQCFSIFNKIKNEFGDKHFLQSALESIYTKNMATSHETSVLPKTNQITFKDFIIQSRTQFKELRTHLLQDFYNKENPQPRFKRP